MQDCDGHCVIQTNDTKHMWLAGYALSSAVYAQWRVHVLVLVPGQDHAVLVVLHPHVAASITDYRPAGRCPNTHGDCSTSAICTECFLVWEDRQGGCQTYERAAWQGTPPLISRQLVFLWLS